LEYEASHKQKIDFINNKFKGVYNDEALQDHSHYKYNSKWRHIMNAIGLKKGEQPWLVELLASMEET
jgi:hypothetical protein